MPQTNIENIILMSECDSYILDQIKLKNSKINTVSWEQSQQIGSSYTDYTEKVTPDDLAVILYTSGSNGEPKPISISNKVYSNMVEIVSKTTDVTKGEKERVVGVVSHEYPYAAINSTIMIILLGKTLIMQEIKENSKTNKVDFNNLLQHHPNRIQAIPNFYKLLEMTHNNKQ